MQVRYELTLGDLRLLRLHYLWRTPGLRWRIATGLLAGPAAFVVAIATLEPGKWFNPWAVAGLCGVMLPAAVVVGCVLNAERVARIEAGVEGVLGEHTLAITEAGIVDSDSAGSTLSDWSQISGVRLVAGYVLFLRHDGNLYAVPRRAFGGIEEARAFAARARELREAERRAG